MCVYVRERKIDREREGGRRRGGLRGRDEGREGGRERGGRERGGRERGGRERKREGEGEGERGGREGEGEGERGEEGKGMGRLMSSLTWLLKEQYSTVHTSKSSILQYNSLTRHKALYVDYFEAPDYSKFTILYSHVHKPYTPV